MNIIHEFKNNHHEFKIHHFADVYFVTSGDGLWSAKAKQVTVTAATLIADMYVKEGFPQYGELRVYFDHSWNVYQDGLIYTDSAFLTSLRQHLINIGFTKQAAEDVDYSEQGMQGNNFVSLDADSIFTKQVVSAHVINSIVNK